MEFLPEYGPPNVARVEWEQGEELGGGVDDFLTDLHSDFAHIVSITYHQPVFRGPDDGPEPAYVFVVYQEKVR